MSDQELEFQPLPEAFVQNLQGEIPTQSVHAMSMGFLLLLAIMAIYTLFRKGLRNSLARKILLVAVILVLTCSLIIFSLNTVMEIDAISLVGPDPVPVTYFLPLATVIIIASRINYLVSDMIVVWRAWVLSEHIPVRCGLVASMVITIGCAITEAALTFHGRTAGTPSKNALFDLLLFVPVLITNTFATAVVGHRIWTYRRQIKIHFSQQKRATRVEKVLILLLESGAIYATIWVLNMISAFGSEPDSTFHIPDWLDLLLAASLPYTSASYPTAIILLVTHGHTSDPTSLADAPTNSIHFAPPPPVRRQRPASHLAQSHSLIQSIADHMRSEGSSDEESHSAGTVHDMQTVEEELEHVPHIETKASQPSRSSVEKRDLSLKIIC